MAYFTKKNAKIFYECYGDGSDWITLVNGYTRTSSDFKLLGSFLAERGKKILVFDNRGSGRTESVHDFRLEDVVRDVVDLWKYLEVDKSHLLGISMGGLIAQMLAAESPEHLRSLCLISTSARPERFPTRFVWPSIQTEIEQSLRLYFHQSFLEKNPLLFTSMAKHIAKANQDGSWEHSASQQRRAFEQVYFEGSSLQGLKLPCLIVHGKDDRIVPVEEALHLQKLIPQSELHIYENTGHMILVEQRSDFYERIARFFEAT